VNYKRGQNRQQRKVFRRRWNFDEIDVVFVDIFSLTAAAFFLEVFSFLVEVVEVRGKSDRVANLRFGSAFFIYFE